MRSGVGGGCGKKTASVEEISGPERVERMRGEESASVGEVKVNGWGEKYWWIKRETWEKSEGR